MSSHEHLVDWQGHGHGSFAAALMLTLLLADGPVGIGNGPCRILGHLQHAK